VCRASWHSENLIKTPLIDIVGAFLGGLGGLSPPKPPVARRLCGSGIIIGSFCAIESCEQSLAYDFTICLDISFCNHEDKKLNSTEQACRVLILSSISLPTQKAWQWLSHLLQTSGGSRGGSLGQLPPQTLVAPLEWRSFAINAPLFGAHGSRNRDKKYSEINNSFA